MAEPRLPVAMPEPLIRPSDLLSLREREVIAGVITGEHDREIGQRLGISPYTVRAHLTRIFTKLGTWSRTELAVYAITHGLELPAITEAPKAHTAGGSQ